MVRAVADAAVVYGTVIGIIDEWVIKNCDYGFRVDDFIADCRRGVTIVKTAILARILTPVDFGQFGAAALSLSLFEVLTETGVNQALIYSDKKGELVNQAWTVAIIRGIIISVLIALSAW